MRAVSPTCSQPASDAAVDAQAGDSFGALSKLLLRENGPLTWLQKSGFCGRRRNQDCGGIKVVSSRRDAVFFALSNKSAPATSAGAAPLH